MLPWRWPVRAGPLGLLLGLCLGTVLAAAQPAQTKGCPPQATSAAPPAAGPSAAPDRGLLWRISRDGRTSYLYGTVHVARAQWMVPGPLTAQALDASDTIALELDVLDADIQRRLAAGMLAGPDDRLPSALAERLRAQLQAACLPQEAMAQLAPAVQLAAVTTLAARWDGLDPAYAIDGFLAAYGRAQGKTVRSLETPELQLALLRGDPRAVQDDLTRGLTQLERGQVRPMLVRITQAWDEGREGELARYEEWCDCANTAAERADLKRLLDDRNLPLAERIDALHSAGQRVFAAVGALHMVGPVGLPALLARRGFEVQRVELVR